MIASLRFSRWAAAPLAAAALACGGHRAGNAGAGGPPGDVGSPGAPCGGIVTIRLKGVDGGAFDAFHLAVAPIVVQVGGAAVTVQEAASGPLDLLVAGAWRLGAVALPEPGTPIDVVVPVVGGDAHATTGAAATFDGCAAPLSVRIDPAQVSPVYCHAVIHVDLAGSAPALAGGDGLVLAPHFSLHY